jgi:hypothetical protein
MGHDQQQQHHLPQQYGWLHQAAHHTGLHYSLNTMYSKHYCTVEDVVIWNKLQKYGYFSKHKLQISVLSLKTVKRSSVTEYTNRNLATKKEHKMSIKAIHS